jgi:hypothetical protein
MGSLSKKQAQLTPRDATSVLWAASQLAYRWGVRASAIGIGHFGAQLAQYRPVDIIGMLWACGQLSAWVPGGRGIAVCS